MESSKIIKIMNIDIMASLTNIQTLQTERAIWRPIHEKFAVKYLF